jgi:hypothetical protein
MSEGAYLHLKGRGTSNEEAARILSDNTSDGSQEELKDSIRLAVDERLAGIQAVRDGIMDVYFLTGPPDREPVQVRASNADEVEAKLRAAFSGRYPDLIEQEQE